MSKEIKDLIVGEDIHAFFSCFVPPLRGQLFGIINYVLKNGKASVILFGPDGSVSEPNLMSKEIFESCILYQTWDEIEPLMRAAIE